eukprot:sb/3460655/
MSDSYDQELDRLSKLVAEAADPVETAIKTEPKLSPEPEKRDEVVEVKSQEGSSKGTSRDGSDSGEESEPEYRKARRLGALRVTRKATGSLPPESKTLLQETTEVVDEEGTKVKPRAKPGHTFALVPDCASCGSDVVLRPYKRLMLLHPYLKTAMCRSCHDFYHSDVFAHDEEGSLVYCIWCGEGGELIYCEKCEKPYCSDCIKRNFGRKKRDEILAESNWECFICVPGPLDEAQKVGELIVKYQNCCIKDPLLVEKYEHEVPKSETKRTDYETAVSNRIRSRNTTKLLTPSQQEEESKKSSSSSEEEEEMEVTEVKSEEEEEKSSESGSEFDVHEERASSKPAKKKKNGEVSSDNDDSDDDAFLENLRKKTTDRTERTTTNGVKGGKGGEKKKDALKDDSDDSLFDTGNPNIKPTKVRGMLEDSDAAPYESDDADNETVQKYRNKLATFKPVDSPEEKESEHSNFSDDSMTSQEPGEDDPDSEGPSSESSGMLSEEDGEKEKEKENGEEKDGEKAESKKKTDVEKVDKKVEENGKDKPKKRGRPRKKKNGTDGEEVEEGEEKKQNGKTKKRKRRKRKATTATETDSEDENADGKKRKRRKQQKGKRKKIRKILGQNQLTSETQKAQEAEDERRQKLKEKLLPSEQGKILNFILEDMRTDKTRGKEPSLEDEEKGRVIEVHKHLKKRLKPHQLDGIQFMYDCCIESKEKVQNGSEGSGCILAHCMGLGKTFQVITFVTTILNYHYIFGFKRALVVCPLNTVRNWSAEFDKWLKDMDDAPSVFILTDNIVNNDKRAEVIEDWYETSGVLIIGYSMFRLLSMGTNQRKKHLKETFRKCLLDPGPDIVICDEGHMIKNEKTGIAKALHSLKTKRRIILTGTPLQNNLLEYHCMVNFVKPNLLGTVKEFRNMYDNPIVNGQCVDASEFDIKLMKERSHILFEHLSGCVQRRDYIVLKEFLPEKYEYVLSIKLSDLQVKLYQKFLDQAKNGKAPMTRLFECYQVLKKVWTHPWLLEIDALKNEKDSIEDFITDRETSEESWEPSSEDSDFGARKKKKKKGKKEEDEVKEEKKDEDEIQIISDIPAAQADAAAAAPTLDANWFKGEMNEKDEKMLEHSGKLLVTLEILDKASQKGDKVLLFSQSLLALDFLETSINRVGWTKGQDYYRMDGSTKTAHRSMFCKKFNDKSNKRCRLFLISTKAGGLGINLVSANRIILFDMSWNPSDDTQSLFRAYRYGQAKNVYVYRLVARGTMEEKIYDRQVYKESLSSRVVDEKQINRYFTANDLQELFRFDPDAQTCTTSVLANHNPPADDVLASILVDLDPPLVLEYHEHDSLLEHRPEQQLTEEERKAAWENFKRDKERKHVVHAPMGASTSVFQRLKAHTQAYQGPIITPLYSNEQELILGGFTPDQIVSIQAQLQPVVQAGKLQVKPLGDGKLHILGLAPDQQQVFINSIKEQQAQQIHQAQLARMLPTQHLLSQVPELLVRDVRIISDRNSRRCKGIAYIEFFDEDAVQPALKLSGTKIMGIPIQVQHTQAEKNRAAMLASMAKEQGPTRLYVGGLHCNITEQMLKAIFDPFGYIDSLQLMIDPETNRSRGYGFVQYRDPESARRAKEQLNGFELAGKPIKVGEVTEKLDNSLSMQTSVLDDEDTDRGGIEMNANARVQLMQKLASDSDNPYLNPISATFDEFVRGVIAGFVPGSNHWKPAAEYCTPCGMNYAYIIKSEEYTCEFDHFLRAIGHKSEDRVDKRVNFNPVRAPKDRTDVYKFYASVSDDLLDSLYNYSKSDCEIFQYDCKELIETMKLQKQSQT